LGFLGRERPNLEGIYDLSLVNDVVKAKGLKAIQ